MWWGYRSFHLLMCMKAYKGLRKGTDCCAKGWWSVMKFGKGKAAAQSHAVWSHENISKVHSGKQQVHLQPPNLHRYHEGDLCEERFRRAGAQNPVSEEQCEWAKQCVPWSVLQSCSEVLVCSKQCHGGSFGQCPTSAAYPN